MTQPIRPKKTLRTLTHLLFPKSAPTRHVVEYLPQSQTELELALGRKFLGALAHFHRRAWTALELGEEPADVRCLDEHGHQVFLQLVEAIDQQDRKLREMRREYSAALRETDRSLLAPFTGCELSLADVGDPPYLPRMH